MSINQKEPKFSIIMPTYNRAFCIENAINSLLAQTYKNYELIIIDDGSTDNTEKLLKNKYSKYFIRGKFIYEYKSNEGVCTARNTGLKKANNDWIAYLDTDNEITPTFLEEFKKAMISNIEAKCFYAQMNHPNIGVIGKAFSFTDLCKENYIDMGCFVHHKSLVSKYGNFDTKLKRLVDWDLILRYTRQSTPIFIEKVLLNYSDDNSYTRITNSEKYETSLRRLKLKIKIYKIINFFQNFRTSCKKLGMKLYRSIKWKINNIKISYRIKKDNVKFVHLMFNDKFNKPFVDFLNSNFNSKEHLILCKKVFDQYPFPLGENVIKIDRFKKLNFNKCKKIICHSLFDNELVEYLYNHKKILKEKAYWVIWGGDLYNAPRDEKNDFVRKNLKGYISDTDGDCQIAMKKYQSFPEIIEGGYTFPITAKMLSKTKHITKDFIQIQINNSSDDTTIEMLEILSRFKNENIRVTTILSYGKTEFKKQIIQKGKKLFGSKFTYIENYMEPQEYSQHLAQNDILILNQNRQQGLGNSFASLALGAKLFIKSEITTYQHFNSRNIKVFDTNKIKDFTFEEFCSYEDEIKDNNIKKTKIFFENDYLKSLWINVFK